MSGVWIVLTTALLHARGVAERSASDLHAQRAGSSRASPYPASRMARWVGDPRQSARDPGVRRRQKSNSAPNDLAVGGLFEPSVLRLSLGRRSGQPSRTKNSPFNECAHAYLAAGRALLLQAHRMSPAPITEPLTR